METKRQKKISLLSGVLIMITFGSAYSISAWNAHFKDVLHLTNSEITMLSAMASFGMYLSIIPGFFYDRFGVQLTIGTGGICMSFCYLYLYLSVTTWSSVPEWTRSFVFFFTGLSGGLMVCPVLGSNEGLFGVHYRGKVIGLLMAAFSFGGALYTYLYSILFQPNVADYFLFLGINYFLVCFLGVFLLLPSHYTGKKNEYTSLLVESTAMNITGWELFSQIEYWLLSLCMIATIGGALLVMANMAFIVEAAGGPSADVPFYVAMFSLCNMFGRVGVGWAMDYTYTTQPRTVYLNVALVVALTSNCLFLIVPENMLIIPICLSGMQEGCMFSIFPVIVREYFGPVNFGKNFGFVSLANAVGYPLFLQPISAMLYHIYATHRPGQVEKCFGHECYGYMFGGCIVLCLIGLLCARRF